MDTLIVYLDDAPYAQQMLAPMLNSNTPTRWVLVACAPRMSRRIGKWLSHSARENWREKWSEKLFAQIVPILQERGDSWWCMVANKPLPELTQDLRLEIGAAQVVDARRPKLNPDTPPVVFEPIRSGSAWHNPSAIAGLGFILMLAAD